MKIFYFIAVLALPVTSVASDLVRNVSFKYEPYTAMGQSGTFEGCGYRVRTELEGDYAIQLHLTKGLGGYHSFASDVLVNDGGAWVPRNSVLQSIRIDDRVVEVEPYNIFTVPSKGHSSFTSSSIPQGSPFVLLGDSGFIWVRIVDKVDGRSILLQGRYVGDSSLNAMINRCLSG